MPIENTTTIQNDHPNIVDQITAAASQAKDKIDQSRPAAASSLENAASAIHQKATDLPGGERVAGIAHSAADTLTSTARYVRQHDVNGMMSDVTSFVKRNPGPSLIAAVVAGFMVGRIFTRE